MDNETDFQPRKRRGTRFTIGTANRGADGDSGSGSGSSEESTSTNPSELWDDSAQAPPVKRRQSRKTDTTAAKGAAELMIGCVETLAYARYRRNDAFMNPTERKMAVDGMANSVKILPPEVVSQISSLSAPVMACFGFTLYFMRLGEFERQYRVNRRDDQVSASAEDILAQQPVYPNPEPPSYNGTAPAPPPVDVIRSLQEN